MVDKSNFADVFFSTVLQHHSTMARMLGGEPFFGSPPKVGTRVRFCTVANMEFTIKNIQNSQPYIFGAYEGTVLSPTSVVDDEGCEYGFLTDTEWFGGGNDMIVGWRHA